MSKEDLNGFLIATLVVMVLGAFVIGLYFGSLIGWEHLEENIRSGTITVHAYEQKGDKQ